MKCFFESIALTFAMYSKIPVPQVEWNEKNMRLSLIFLPVVGAVVAAVLYLVFYLFTCLDLSPVFFAAVAVLVIVLITGGIHLDGYCDTIDALSSHQNREGKLRILKDPHVGAFAVIYTSALLLLQFGAFSQVFPAPHSILIVLPAFILSRALAGLSLLSFPCARDTGLASAFAGSALKKIVRAVLNIYIALCFLAVLFVDILSGFTVILFIFLSFIWFYFMSKKHFGGLTGDLAGFYIVICETGVILIAAITGGMMN